MTQIDRLIDTAAKELGTAENPAGSNRTKYGAAYGWDGVPWCVMFLWWCFREAGLSSLFCGGEKTASCTALQAWYEARGRTVSPETARRGDIVLLNFAGRVEPQHCALVLDSPIQGRIWTIEGNTSPTAGGSQPNGGEVAEKRRYVRQIVGVCRPAYPDEPPDDCLGHWAEEDIRWAFHRDLLRGYGDGTWRPDKPVTRAELAAVLHRMSGKEA